MSIDTFSFAVKRVGWGRFASTFLLSYAQIIATEFALGLVHALNSLALVVINIAISSTIIYLLNRRFGRELFSKYWNNINSNIRHFRGDAKKDVLWMLLLIVAALIVAWVVFLGAIFPVTDFDGNSYHLTFVANTIQTQSFFDAPTSLGWLTGYPKGGEFIEMWNVLIARNDMFVDLVQVPFLFLGIYALYTISRRVGVDERQARFTSLLFVFIPVVLNQLKTTYVDVMLCSLFFAAIAMTIQKKLSKLDYLLIGIIYSLLISVKFTGFLFVAATVPLLLWNLYVNLPKSKKKQLTSYLPPLVIVFLPTLFGFYWYVKDYILYGSPLYPFGLKLAGLTIFPGKTFQEFADGAISSLTYLPHGALDRIWFVWTEQRDWFGCFYNYDTNYVGLGPVWFVLLIPAVTVSAYLAIKKKNYLFGALAAIVLAVFAIYPTDYYTRYTMFIIVLGIVALGIVLSNIKSWAVNLVKVAAILLALVVIYTNFTFCNFGTEVIKAQIKGGLDSRAPGTVFAYAFGPAHAYLRSIVKPGDTVAYSSTPYFIYPLWNSDFSDKVIYIPAKDKAEWEKKASQDNVKYVFALIGSKEQKWFDGDKSVKSVFKDEQNEIFQIR